MVQSRVATTLFLNPLTGNDQAPGTRAAPFKTRGRALHQARRGDRLQLAPGTYGASSGETFPLIIPDGVTLIGDEPTKGRDIVILGGGPYQSPTLGQQHITLRLEADSQLRGVTVSNPAAAGIGVWLDSSGAIIAHCMLINCGRSGVWAVGTAKPGVYDTVARRNQESGFSLRETAKGEWRQNVCEGSAVGVAIADQAAPLFADNRIVANQRGMVLTQSCGPVLRGNELERNTEVGLVVSDRALPDLGQAADPGQNIFRDNGKADLSNATPSKVRSAGNQINPARINGIVELVAIAVPDAAPPTPPTPIPAPNVGALTDITNHWAEAWIRGLVQRGTMSGFPDGTFRPDAPMPRAQYAAVVASTFERPRTTPAIAFVDVPADFWAKAAIQTATQMGFMAGFADRSFRPGQNLTRVQAIVSLVGGLQLTGGTKEALLEYADRAQIPSYATDKVAIATQRGLVVAYPQVWQLNPMGDSTRAEVAAMIYQALVSLSQAPAIASPYIVTPTQSAPAFTDIAGHWAAPFITALATQDFLGGFPDGQFRPDAAMTRATYAALVVKAFNPLPRRPAIAFTDVASNFWAKHAINRAYQAGFISGIPDGTFRPEQNIQRAQVLASLVSGLQLTGGDQTLLNAYDDRLAIPEYAQTQIATATHHHLVVNYPALRQLNPNRDSTRAEVAAVVCQALVHQGRSPTLLSPYIVKF